MSTLGVATRSPPGESRRRIVSTRRKFQPLDPDAATPAPGPLQCQSGGRQASWLPDHPSAAVYRRVDANREADLMAALRQFAGQIPEQQARTYIETATEMVAALLNQPGEAASPATVAGDDAILSELRRLAARLNNRAARVHLECAIQEAEDWRRGKDVF